MGYVYIYKSETASLSNATYLTSVYVSPQSSLTYSFTFPDYYPASSEDFNIFHLRVNDGISEDFQDVTISAPNFFTQNVSQVGWYWKDDLNNIYGPYTKGTTADLIIPGTAGRVDIYGVWNGSCEYKLEAGIFSSYEYDQIIRNDTIRTILNYNGGVNYQNQTSTTYTTNKRKPFIGWYVNDDISSHHIHYGEVVTENNFTIFDDKVYLYDGHATTASYGPVPLNTRVTREGYDLLGYAESATATVAQYQPGENYIPTVDNKILYAVWRPKGAVHIYHNNAWHTALPYIYSNNAWHQAIPYVYNGTEWKLSI